MQKGYNFHFKKVKIHRTFFSQFHTENYTDAITNYTELSKCEMFLSAPCTVTAKYTQYAE